MKSYASAREDRDYLLEYKSINLNHLRRVELLGVPVDNVNRDEAAALILDLVEKKSGPHHVFFLDPLKLMRVRPGKKLSYIPKTARMILADGAGLEWCAGHLGTPLKERISMISLIMDLIRAAWKQDLTIYFFGSKPENLEKINFNLQRIFPGIRIIGRQGGYYNASRENLIKESMRKSSPDIILLGMGFPKQEQWIRDNWEHLSQAVVLGVDGAFDILSGKERKAPDYFQNRGLVWFWRTISRPWMIHRLYLMVRFFLATYWLQFKNRKSHPVSP